MQPFKKVFCEDDYINNYRKIGKYYVSQVGYQTDPPKYWVVYNNNGIEERRVYLATHFLEILLKEGIYDAEFEKYITYKDSKFMRKINKYLPPEKQFSEIEILELQQKENKIYRELIKKEEEIKLTTNKPLSCSDKSILVHLYGII